ncbi:MAG: energy transducer TonB, partial [Bacteroidota bacterium]
MKIWSLVLFSFYTSFLFAQTADSTEVFSFCETMPQYPGGDSALFQFIKATVHYPESCLDSAIQGKVYLSCIIEKDGKVSGVQLVKRVHPALDREALRVISLLSSFNPGLNGGKAVRARINIPVVFKITIKENVSTKSSDVLKVISDVDVQPEFPGGVNTLTKFMDMKVKYPFVCQQLNIQGLCQV